jgi:hypothetical protein
MMPTPGRWNILISGENGVFQHNPPTAEIVQGMAPIFGELQTTLRNDAFLGR